MMSPQPETRTGRRAFLKQSAAIIAAGRCLTHTRATAADDRSHLRVPELARSIGIVTASMGTQLTNRAVGRNFTLLELPRILRDELDLSVIDLNTSSIPGFAKVKSAYLEKLRTATDKAGCVITNLKMNQAGIDMNSSDREVRNRALAEYKRSIDIAAELGCRWARPLPRKDRPDMARHIASYQELCEYGSRRKVQLLVENYGWMQADSQSVVQLIKQIGDNVAAGVDIGNWDSNEIRYAGLKASFPYAATCDFKARQLGPAGEHPQYDLKRCFELAWEAGFQGPWCFEHGHRDTKTLFRELSLLRDMIRKWMPTR